MADFPGSMTYARIMVLRDTNSPPWTQQDRDNLEKIKQMSWSELQDTIQNNPQSIGMKTESGLINPTIFYWLEEYQKYLLGLPN